MDVTEKKVVLIGIGNCGNQVVNLGERKYPELFDCVYINTSDSDLAMVNSQDGMKFKIGAEADYEVEGSGKNRKKMKEYLRDDIEAIIKNEQFKDSVTYKKYAFVIVSGAGGTGSGAGPVFTNIMQDAFPDTNFVLIGVLPRQGSSLLELGNAVEFLDELYHKMSPATTYMIYDNETRTDLSVTNSLTDVNENIIEDLRIFTGVDNFPTPFESIDDADMEMIVSTPGRLMVTRVPSEQLTEKCLEDGKLDEIIVKAIKKSAHAETDRNKKVVRWGIITYLNNEVNQLYTPDLPSLESFLGSPIERFNHNAINDGSEKLNFMHVIASGLSPINDRVAKITNRINELNDAVAKAKNDKYAADVNVADMISGLRKEVSKSGEADKKFSVADAFDKFM